MFRCQVSIPMPGVVYQSSALSDGHTSLGGWRSGWHAWRYPVSYTKVRPQEGSMGGA